eukprot:gene8374-14348_t
MSQTQLVDDIIPQFIKQVALPVAKPADRTDQSPRKGDSCQRPFLLIRLPLRIHRVNCYEMKLLILLILGLAVSIHGETVDEANTALDEPEESDAFENDDDFNEDDLEALADPDELEALEEADVEEKDPFVVQSIQYYCRFCKICSACKRARKCSGGLMKKACKYCKYCNPRTYWDLVRRVRIRIRLRRIRLRRWGGRRRRRRRRRG